MGEEKDGNPRVLGVLGGMGPAATIDFLQKLLRLTEADRDQEQIPTFTYNNTAIPDRNEAYLRGGESPAPELRKSAAALEKAGANLIAIPCNTAHLWFRDIQEATSLEVLNMTEIAAEYVRKDETVGIISTTPVKISGLYASPMKDKGANVVYPENQDSVMEAIYRIKGGDIQGGRALFLEQISELEQKGAGYILAGCSEVSLAVDRNDIRGTLVDPLECLAVECIKRFGKEVAHANH